MSKPKLLLFRSYFLQICIYLFLCLLFGRLFYWQIIKGSDLAAAAQDQYTREVYQNPSRGSIYTQDGHLLVGNEPVYRLFAEKKILDKNSDDLANILTDLVIDDDWDYQKATESSQKQEISDDVKEDLRKKLDPDERNWVSLRTNISAQTKKKIDSLNLKGLGFDVYEKRYYPEASMAAQVTGFVGKDENGEDIGYFGIEGAMNNELKGFSKVQNSFIDALGLRILFQNQSEESSLVDGRDVYLNIRRDVQRVLEDELADGLERYQAKSAEVIVMDPKTGKILGMASFPKYDQSHFFEYDPSLYKNPSLSDLYEPGSTFKTLTVAAGIDQDVVEADTKCDACSGPVEIGKYTIKTWNDEYHPDIEVKDALAISDNTAMIFIARRLGKENLIDYFKKFGIGDEIGIELQEDGSTPFAEKWGDVELATRSFGQGIVTNSMQLTRAVACIANDGVMMQPQIIDKVYDKKNHEEIDIEPKSLRRVISAQSAQEMKSLLAYTIDKSYSWLSNKRAYSVAGKSGTAQIADETGSYKEEGTVASFIAFSPVEDPKFIMLVKLVEPQASEWGAETAAPLWFTIADKLQLLF